MIKEEIITIDNKQYVKHTTDKERYEIIIEDNKEKKISFPCLIQVETGKMFFDTIDLYPCQYTYVEYEEPIVEEEA